MSIPASTDGAMRLDFTFRTPARHRFASTRENTIRKSSETPTLKDALAPALIETAIGATVPRALPRLPN